MPHVEDTPANAEQCVCPDCPTYDSCMNGTAEALYCARGESTCEVESRGCTCPECPVWETHRLRDEYYCIEGAAS